jgi:hypothetical protein
MFLGDKLLCYRSDKDLEHIGVIELRDVKDIILKASTSSKPARGDLVSFPLVIENFGTKVLANFSYSSIIYI